ncbi:LOW QUALITY PROTEIN: uncharacterized protein LOC109838431 [Asparagus officinalis]|uniref:LOW QUALITY PROTEIN: uncharacterized protein LOC109838431 n=1 Tax=Asparagus officinalis TaxID=4686 RepID=UPI00098E7667|nr:LOW QUALITY PROTEIN: uncharacterized protein LOC109838431 [Asparagus officinalis]
MEMSWRLIEDHEHIHYGFIGKDSKTLGSSDRTSIRGLHPGLLGQDSAPQNELMVKKEYTHNISSKHRISMVKLVALAILLLFSITEISLASAKKPMVTAARREDILFIRCQVCHKIAEQIYNQVEKKQAQISPKRLTFCCLVSVSEYQIIEIAENVCNLKKEETDWILHIDIVEKEDKLELIEQGTEGLCNSECKTHIEHACQEIIGYSDTDVVEFVYKHRPSVDKLANVLCKDLSDACSKSPPPVPKAILILHVPIQLRNFKIRDPPLLAKKSDKGINLLASLCNIYQTSEDEVKSTMEKVNNIIVNILKKEPCPASECKSENLEFIIAASSAKGSKVKDAAIAKALSYADIPNSQIRKVTSSRLLLSKQTLPHYYLTVDTRVDKLMELRSQLNSLQEASSGKRISINDLVIKKLEMDGEGGKKKPET